MNEHRSVYTWLIAAGALPFALGGVMEAAGVDRLPVVGDTQRFLLTYGLGIVSFLTGIHWATSLYLGGKSPLNLFAFSNAVFLAVWLAYLLASAEIAALVQSGALAVLLAIDYRLYAESIVGRHYLGMRVVATLIAIASLLALAWP